MATRLMTPFCFASLLAAALVVEGRIAATFPAAAESQPLADSGVVPLEAIGGLETADTHLLAGGLLTFN
jgi:hypothetical protein